MNTQDFLPPGQIYTKEILHEYNIPYDLNEYIDFNLPKMAEGGGWGGEGSCCKAVSCLCQERLHEVSGTEPSLALNAGGRFWGGWAEKGMPKRYLATEGLLLHD